MERNEVLHIYCRGRMNTRSKVALDKQKHPDKYCPNPKCLWRTDGGYCPRHK